MDNDKPECVNKTQTDANNEITNNVTQRDAKNEITNDVTNYFNVFNIFECGRNLLDRLDLSYERACMAIQSTTNNPGYFDSEEQVDTKSKSEEQDDAIKNSKEQVDVVRNAKVCRDYSFKNEFDQYPLIYTING